MFKYAQPVFLKTNSPKAGLTGFFAANFDCEGKNAFLSVTCSASCKITVNGDFVCYFAPKVTDYKTEAHLYDISKFVTWGLNQIVIEVFGGSAARPFVIAEVTADEKTVCATGKNFAAFIDTERLPDKLPVNCEALERYQRGGVCMLPCEVSILPHEYLYDIKKAQFDFKIHEFSDIKYPLKLCSGESYIFDFGAELYGNVKFEALAHDKTKLVIGTSKKKEGTGTNLIMYDFEAGEYENESFTPHCQRYVMFHAEKGEVSIYNVSIREYLS